MSSIEIIPTVVPKTFDDVEGARNRYIAFAPRLHIDCVDGQFASNKTWMPLSGEKLGDISTITYEAHLMVENPLSLGLSFARAGAKRIIGHVEAFNNAEHAREVFAMWQKAGAHEIGVAILFATPLSELAPYITLVDFVHIMTITSIGEQGTAFDPRSIDRVKNVHERYPDMPVSTDGGETVANVDDLARAGATRFCIGAVLARAKDPAKEYARLAKAATI